ncbi:hypothetical protein GE061_011710 [Apolygus lucorum]|uniref:Uncharacterized protein n=1 Tax=Apolygus lucorum TaxID=248454 RepID=A0A8S9Y087_APOLU|nr:hypothetical protein GE061_011710 [Apolygus lucorum]
MYLKSYIFVLLVATAFGSPFFNYEAQTELVRLKTLMNAFLKWAVNEEVWEHQKNVMAPNMRNAHFKTTTIESDLSVSYLIFDRIRKERKVVDYFRIDPETLSTSIRMRIPSLSETYRYKINGTLLSHKVRGEGSLTYVATNITMAATNLKFHDSPHNLQLASLDLKAYIGNLQMRFTGLQVEGMRMDAYEKVLQSRLLTLMKDHLNYSRAQVTEFEALLDLEMHDKTLEQVVQWLKSHTRRLSSNKLQIESDH